MLMKNRTRNVLHMDPDSPLNRAHQCERKAERMLANGLHDLALECYQDASDYILQAMEKTTDAVALHSLRLQKENYDKMPNLVKKRKQHSQSRSVLETLQISNTVNTPENGRSEKNEEMSEEEEKEDDRLDGIESEIEICLKSIEPISSMVGVKMASEGVLNGTDSFESLPSTASEDTDSLLQCLDEYSEVNKERRTFYRATSVLTALQAFGMYSSNRKEVDRVIPAVQAEQKVWRKMEKDDQVRFEELAVKNAELRKHIVNLLEQLESCELENTRLRDSLEEAKRQLETHKSQSANVLQCRSAPDFTDEFSVPFSLLAPNTGGETLSSSSSRIVIPQTPPALAPLEMPNFDDQ